MVASTVRFKFSSRNGVTSSLNTINSNTNRHKWCRLICQYKRAVPLTNIDFYLIVEVDKGAECWACLDCVIKALSVLSFSFHVLWFVSVIQSKKMEDWLVPSISFRLRYWVDRKCSWKKSICWLNNLRDSLIHSFCIKYQQMICYTFAKNKW